MGSGLAKRDRPHIGMLFWGESCLKATQTNKPKACPEESRTLSTACRKPAAPQGLPTPRSKPRPGPGWGMKKSSTVGLLSEPVLASVCQQRVFVSCPSRGQAQELRKTRFISVSLFSTACWQLLCLQAPACQDMERGFLGKATPSRLCQIPAGDPCPPLLAAPG